MRLYLTIIHIKFHLNYVVFSWKANFTVVQRTIFQTLTKLFFAMKRMCKKLWTQYLKSMHYRWSQTNTITSQTFSILSVRWGSLFEITKLDSQYKSQNIIGMENQSFSKNPWLRWCSFLVATWMTRRESQSSLLRVAERKRNKMMHMMK